MVKINKKHTILIASLIGLIACTPTFCARKKNKSKKQNQRTLQNKHKQDLIDIENFQKKQEVERKNYNKKKDAFFKKIKAQYLKKTARDIHKICVMLENTKEQHKKDELLATISSFFLTITQTKYYHYIMKDEKDPLEKNAFKVDKKNLDNYLILNGKKPKITDPEEKIKNHITEKILEKYKGKWPQSELRAHIKKAMNEVSDQISVTSLFTSYANDTAKKAQSITEILKKYPKITLDFFLKKLFTQQNTKITYEKFKQFNQYVRDLLTETKQFNRVVIHDKIKKEPRKYKKIKKSFVFKALKENSIEEKIEPKEKTKNRIVYNQGDISLFYNDHVKRWFKTPQQAIDETKHKFNNNLTNKEVIAFHAFWPIVDEHIECGHKESGIKKTQSYYVPGILELENKELTGIFEYTYQADKNKNTCIHRWFRPVKFSESWLKEILNNSEAKALKYATSHNTETEKNCNDVVIYNRAEYEVDTSNPFSTTITKKTKADNDYIKSITLYTCDN